LTVVQGVTRDKKTRTKSLALVNPNWPPEQMAKHMSAELGWVRVRAGSTLRVWDVLRVLLPVGLLSWIRFTFGRLIAHRDAGREDVFASCVKQVGPDRFLVCFSSACALLLFCPLRQACLSAGFAISVTCFITAFRDSSPHAATDVATFVDGMGEPSVLPNEPEKIVFETAPESFGERELSAGVRPKQ
jgi:hypothetical protein